MTATVIDVGAIDEPRARQARGVVRRRRGVLAQAVRAVALLAGAAMGLTMALGHRLPAGEALRAMVAAPQIRVDLSAPATAVCICPVPVAAADLPPQLVRALIAHEDRRFRTHSGVDWFGLARAILADIAGHPIQGGSTITQQLAKNMVVGSARFGIDGIFRKLREAIVAKRVEAVMTKDEILAAYLNTADFGRSDGWTAWGAGMAAEKYFGKPLGKIGLYEAAQLVAVLGATSAYNPARNPAAAHRRTRKVLRAMVAAGLARPAAVAAALKARTRPGSTKPQRIDARYFVDAAIREARAVLGGKAGAVRLVVTLDPAEQQTGKRVMAKALAEGRGRDVTQGALVSMRDDGAVTAMVGGADYGQSQFNRATDAVRSPGSAFKPFVFLAALRSGRGPSSTILDAPDASGWPHNYAGRYEGRVTLGRALAQSLNAATVRLADETGLAEIVTLAHALGIRTELAADHALALGASGVTLVDLVGAYGAIANGGRRVHPYFIVAAYARNGTPLHARRVFAETVIPPSVAATMSKLLRGVVTRGTGVAARDPSRWSAGKTGTSQNYRDAWFVGFTRQRVTGVWVGNDDNRPMAGVTGGTLPAAAWRRFHALADR